MSTVDREFRDQICAVGKLLYDKGLIAGTQGNISCRLPDGGMLITPSGKCKGMLKPEDIVGISQDGELHTPTQKPSSEFLIHALGYDRRREFHAAIHAHPLYATAFTMSTADLGDNVMYEFDTCFGAIPMVPRAKPGTVDLAEELENFISMYHTFLLESHGIISFGGDLMEAFLRVEMAERIAQTVYLSRTLEAATEITEGCLDDLMLDEDEGFDFNERIVDALSALAQKPVMGPRMVSKPPVKPKKSRKK